VRTRLLDVAVVRCEFNSHHGAAVARTSSTAGMHASGTQ